MKNNWKIINSTCKYIYDLLQIFDQSWKKEEEEDRKVLLKLLLTRAKNRQSITFKPNPIRPLVMLSVSIYIYRNAFWNGNGNRFTLAILNKTINSKKNRQNAWFSCKKKSFWQRFTCTRNKSVFAIYFLDVPCKSCSKYLVLSSKVSLGLLTILDNHPLGSNSVSFFPVKALADKKVTKNSW